MQIMYIISLIPIYIVLILVHIYGYEIYIYLYIMNIYYVIWCLYVLPILFQNEMHNYSRKKYCAQNIGGTTWLVV